MRSPFISALAIFFVGSFVGACGPSQPASLQTPDTPASSSVVNTSQISIKKLESGDLVLTLRDACESLSNVVIPESSDFNTFNTQGSTHFASSKPNCSTQSEGTCSCACPSGTSFVVLTASNSTAGGILAANVHVVICSPVSK